MKKIIILGAGPTGLGAAYQLHRLGYKNWQMYERNNYIGGLSASFNDEKGFTWDIGGHIIFSNNNRFNRLVDDLLGDEMLSFIRESWIWLKDNFIKYPFQNNFHMHPDKEIVHECIVGLFNNLNKKGSYSNFEEWINHFFGEGIARHFMIPYNNKVWGFPLNKMDYNWIAERVSIIDIKKVLQNLIYKRGDSEWGPNNTFRYPLYGGITGLFNKFLPYIKEHLRLNKSVTRISTKKKVIVFHDGEKIPYDILVSTIPINELVDKIEPKRERIRTSSKQFESNGAYIVGIGLKKKCPSKKNWIYFPEDNTPFYRMTYLSNYSPNLTPKGKYFSFLAETSYSKHKNVNKKTIVEKTIQGLIKSNLMTEQDRSRIVSTYLIDAPYSFPIPFLARDKLLREIHNFLMRNNIYSRGRFGGWKYEVGNMDHSVLQGIEVVERILTGKKENVYNS